MSKITIDPQAGFCPGVNRAIQLAEEAVQNASPLPVLGELIHNREENQRLKNLGIVAIDPQQFSEHRNQTVLIRAHGEPPKSYQLARENNITLIDGTCKIVHQSQKLAAQYDRNGYQVIIIGKKGHAEVAGIAGHCNQPAIVISDQKDISKIPAEKKLFVLCQTTISREKFQKYVQEIKRLHADVTVKDTICHFISRRDAQIKKFAAENEVIIMVGGKNSSNTAVLFQSCREINLASYWIETPAELQTSWFAGVSTIGISGSASTPHRQLQLVFDRITQMLPNNEFE